MQGEGEIVAKVLSAIFKNRPNCAYTIFAFLLIVFLGAILVKAENTNDLVFPILGLAFVLIVVLGRAIRVIRQQSLQEYQVIDQAPLNQETPLAQETVMPDTEEELHQTPQRKQQIIQYPRLTAKDFIKFILISAAFLVLGYITAQLFFVYMPFVQDKSQIINWIGAEYYNLFIKDTIIQLICGLPCALSITIPIFMVLLLLLYRFSKPNQKILMIIFVILSFIFGLFFYFPIQIFFLFAYAF